MEGFWRVLKVVGASCGGVETAMLDCDATNSAAGIYAILAIIVNTLLVGVGVLAVIGLMVAGVRYLTAGGNVAYTGVAKARIAATVVGIVIYALIIAGVNWLLPTGADFAPPEWVAALTNTSTERRNTYGSNNAAVAYAPGTYDGSRGTVGSLNGTTVLVTVFVGDQCSSWAGKSALVADVHRRLAEATSWVEDAGTSANILPARLRADTRIVWDYEADTDLTTTANFSGFCFADISSSNQDYITTAMQSYLAAVYPLTTPASPGSGYKASVEELRARYAYDDGAPADSVGFLLVVGGTGRSYTVSVNPDYYGNSLAVNLYEACVIFAEGPGVEFAQEEDYKTTTYAHEIIHLYGAGDLYYNDGDYNASCPGDVMNAFQYISASTTAITSCTQGSVY